MLIFYRKMLMDGLQVQLKRIWLWSHLIWINYSKSVFHLTKYGEAKIGIRGDILQEYTCGQSSGMVKNVSHGVEIELIFALWAAVSEIQNCHIWAWNLAFGQSSRSCTYTLFLPQGGEIDLIFTLRAAVSEIWADFQNCHIWAWNLGIG